MREMSVHHFRSNLKAVVEKVIGDHDPLRVTRRSGGDFVVMAAADWEQEQETLHVLQNRSLMQQIADSLETHRRGTGYRPGDEELDAIDRL